MRIPGSVGALCAFSLFAPACVSLDDLPRVPGDSSSVDAPDDAFVEPPSPDAAVSNDAGQQPDASACTNDSQCSGEETCSLSTGLCDPRCTDEGGCAVAAVNVARYGKWGAGWEALGDDSGTFYYLTDFEEDQFGNPIGGLKLWKLPLNGQPALLSDNVGTTLTRLRVATSEHVYFQRGGLLSRIAVDGSGREMIDTDVTASWRSASYIWWSKTTGAGSELYQTPVSGALAPVLVGSASHAGWGAGNDAWVVRALGLEATESLQTDALPSLSSSTPLATIYYAREVVADEEAVYVAAGVVGLTRYSTDPLVPPAQLAPADGGLGLELQGAGWGYCAMADGVARTHRDQPARGGPVLANIDDIDGFAALPNAIAYVAGGHLFVKHTPLPCATDLPCPTGFSCTAAGTCEQ